MFPRALFFWNYVFLFLYMADFCWPERQDGNEDGLLVHMPTKHERTQSTNQQAAQETAGPAGSQPQVRHRWLRGEKQRRQNSNFCLCNQKVRREATAVWAETHQDGQQRAHKCDGGRHGGQDRVLKLLHQAARHWSSRKLRLLQQLQLCTWTGEREASRHLCDDDSDTAGRRRRSLTQHNHAFVQHVVQGPDVGGPVGMAEAPLKGEEPGQNLRELTLKQQQQHDSSILTRPPSFYTRLWWLRFVTMAMKGPKESAHTETTMPPKANRRRRLKLPQRTEPSAHKQSTSSPTGWPLNCSLGGLRFCTTFVVLSEAVAPQQEHSVGWRHVQVDVFQVEQNGKQQCPLQVLSLHNAQNM